MSELLAFMGAHPILTVVLALILGQTLVYTAQALRGARCPCEHVKDDGEEL